MQLALDRSSEISLREQITAAIRERIQRGELALGARLPSSRELADELGVNRTTVVQSYDDLRGAGLVESGVGRGTFVSARPPATTENGSRKSRAAGTSQSDPKRPIDWNVWLPRGRPLPTLSGLQNGQPVQVPLSRAVGHPDFFPAERIRSALDRAFEKLGSQLLGYSSPAGYQPLRDRLRERLAQHGVAVERNEILIVNGSQQGLDLVARLLLCDGGAVITSRPSYSAALDVFRWYRAQLLGVPLTAEGLERGALVSALGNPRARLLYVIPDRHNPTGLSLSQEGRAELLALAQRQRVPVLEDDWLAELRGAQEPAPLKAHDDSDQVLYLGTFSKVLAPGLRIGWLCVPKTLFEPLLALKKTGDLATNLPAQAVVHELLASGFLDEHVGKLKLALERRRQLVDAVIDAAFPPEARPLRPHSGMVLWIELPRGADVAHIVSEAGRVGVEIAPGSPFDPGSGEISAIRLSYATANEADLKPALERLGRVLKQTLFHGRHGRGATAPPLV